MRALILALLILCGCQSVPGALPGDDELREQIRIDRKNHYRGRPLEYFESYRNLLDLERQLDAEEEEREEADEEYRRYHGLDD